VTNNRMPAKHKVQNICDKRIYNHRLINITKKIILKLVWIYACLRP
jgi:hypothetical protein